MDRYFGCNLFMRELKQRIIKQTGLPISYALASNKLISKVATNENKPNGQAVIDFGEERSYWLRWWCKSSLALAKRHRPCCGKWAWAPLNIKRDTAAYDAEPLW